MKIFSIPTGYFKLDGGAMFGVVPKMLWNKLNPADELNLCNWSMRCMLVQAGDKNILIDTGIGNKQSEKFYSHYYLSGDDTLEQSLANAGLSAADITDVLLTHLHFDHCGGAVKKVGDAYVPTFENATYHVHEAHWNHANNPNAREKASFLPENFLPLQAAGKLNFVETDAMLHDCIEIKVFYGHTIAMVCPIVHYKSSKILYGADLFPSSAHLPVNYVMGYDIQPLITMQERKTMNDWAIANDAYVFYEHDPKFAISKVALNEKGQYVAVNAREEIAM